MKGGLEAALNQYVHEVLRFTKALNLTSVDRPETFYRKFVVPSLALLDYLPEKGKLLDVGSGMGIPSVPILLARPMLFGVLVERRLKRAEFLRHLQRLLGFQGTVYGEDLEVLQPLHVDACVARAVARPERLLQMCSRHVRSEGVAILPVALTCKPVEVTGWSCFKDQTLQFDGWGQRVHGYIHREVSRET